jgi:hypothetical protein
VGLLRIIALLGPRNGHTGLFPGDPSNTRELHLYPLRLYEFPDGVYVVDAVDRSLVGTRLVAVEGVPVAQALERVEPLVPRDNDSNLRGMAPHFLLTAEVLDGLDIVDGTSSAVFRLARADEQEVDVSLGSVPASRYIETFNDPLHGHYPSILPRAAKPLYLSGRRAADVGAHDRGWTGGVLRLQLRPAADARIRRRARTARAKPNGSTRDRRRATQRRRRQHDVRLARRPPRLQAGEPARTAVSPDGAGDVLGGRELRCRDRSRHPGDRRRRADGGRDRDLRGYVPVSLPTAGWTVHIAARYHERKRGPSDRRLAVEPDVRVDLTSAQYFVGRDPVLERALRGL